MLSVFFLLEIVIYKCDHLLQRVYTDFVFHHACIARNVLTEKELDFAMLLIPSTFSCFIVSLCVN